MALDELTGKFTAMNGKVSEFRRWCGPLHVGACAVFRRMPVAAWNHTCG